MRLPNFFVIGAQKCGTTALYQYLHEHPAIYMSPVKETRFFALAEAEAEFQEALAQAPKEILRESRERYDRYVNRAVMDWNAYVALFDGVQDEKAIGEATPIYLYFPRTAERIRQHLPEAKLVAILRDPVERAYSAFAFHVQLCWETILDFAQAVQKEDPSVRNCWWGRRHYLRQGLYGEQLKHYYDTFDRSQIKVYLYEDLVSDPVGLMQDLYRFLGVEDTFVPQVSKKRNVTRYPKNTTLHALLVRKGFLRRLLHPLVSAKLRQVLRNLRRSNMVQSRPTLAPELRQRLLPVFREDILLLQELIQRDLSHWMK